MWQWTLILCIRTTKKAHKHTHFILKLDNQSPLCIFMIIIIKKNSNKNLKRKLEIEWQFSRKNNVKVQYSTLISSINWMSIVIGINWHRIKFSFSKIGISLETVSCLFVFVWGKLRGSLKAAYLNIRRPPARPTKTNKQNMDLFFSNALHKSYPLSFKFIWQWGEMKWNEMFDSIDFHYSITFGNWLRNIDLKKKMRTKKTFASSHKNKNDEEEVEIVISYLISIMKLDLIEVIKLSK